MLVLCTHAWGNLVLEMIVVLVSSVIPLLKPWSPYRSLLTKGLVSEDAFPLSLYLDQMPFPKGTREELS